MTKTIVITRAKGDEAALVDALHTQGYRTIHEALTEIFLHHTARQELHHALLEEPDAVIATSRHGARALAALTDLRDVAVLCVGQTTADAATSSGFTRVYTAGGNAAELVTYIADAYDSSAHFLYASAAHTRVDLPELLAAYGAHVDRLVVYEAAETPSLSDTLTQQLKQGQIDAFTFLSQRSAGIFVKLLEKAELQDALPNLQAFCLSETIAQPLQGLPWRGIHSAAKPTLASLIDCVDNALS